jgi:hypothetical protein
MVAITNRYERLLQCGNTGGALSWPLTLAGAQRAFHRHAKQRTKRDSDPIAGQGAEYPQPTMQAA